MRQVLVLGDSEKSCGEWGDRTTLALPQDQPELLRRVLDTGVPVVLVLINGRPVSFETDPRVSAGGYAEPLDLLAGVTVSNEGRYCDSDMYAITLSARRSLLGVEHWD